MKAFSKTFWKFYRRDTLGAAAAEFALILTLLAIPLLSAVDFGIYIYQGMEFSEAMQIGAQAAFTTCSKQPLPATSHCGPALTAAVNQAVGSTSLCGGSFCPGSGVQATISEGYYCASTGGATSGTLVPVGTFPGTKPADCSGATGGGSATDAPATTFSLLQPTPTRRYFRAYQSPPC